MLASPFVAMGIIEGGVAALAAVQSQVTNIAIQAATRGIVYFYRYAPAAGAFGKFMAEMLDESGSVMTGGVVELNFLKLLFRKGKDYLVLHSNLREKRHWNFWPIK
jgi:hypothetical protein